MSKLKVLKIQNYFMKLLLSGDKRYEYRSKRINIEPGDIVVFAVWHSRRKYEIEYAGIVHSVEEVDLSEVEEMARRVVRKLYGERAKRISFSRIVKIRKNTSQRILSKLVEINSKWWARQTYAIELEDDNLYREVLEHF